MRRIKESYQAWGVRWSWNREKAIFLCGRYWFGKIPPQMNGHVVCAFATKREAVEALKSQDSQYGKGRVVRITVDVREKVSR